MNYREMWAAAWQFQKKYQEVQSDDEYWTAMGDEAEEIAQQFNDNRFVRDLLGAVMFEFDRQYKEMKQSANT